MPGPEEAGILKSLEEWTQSTGYRRTAVEDHCCGQCRQRALQWVTAGNVIAAGCALAGSRFGFRLAGFSMKSAALATGSAIVGGLGGWCLANMACVWHMLELPASPLTMQLASAVENGTVQVRLRYARGTNDHQPPPIGQFADGRPSSQ